mgnify:CR=1 FL=1
MRPIGVLPEGFRMLRKDPYNLNRVMPAEERINDTA